MIASPALLVAMTQIYPDVISGILITCAILEIAMSERTGELTRAGLVVASVSIAYLPWLQPKNFAPAIILLGALGITLRRNRRPVRLAVIAGTAILLSWLLLVIFNLWFFGHALGVHEPPVHISGSGTEYTLGLLFGRDQGLFVQVPSRSWVSSGFGRPDARSRWPCSPRSAPSWPSCSSTVCTP